VPLASICFGSKYELMPRSNVQVMSAVYPPSGKTYAIKIINKDHLVRKNMVETAHVEKNVLTKLGAGAHPGVVRMHWAFQDQWSLCELLSIFASALEPDNGGATKSLCSTLLPKANYRLEYPAWDPYAFPARAGTPRR